MKKKKSQLISPADLTLNNEFGDTELDAFFRQKKFNDQIFKTLSLVLESMAEGVTVTRLRL